MPGGLESNGSSFSNHDGYWRPSSSYQNGDTYSRTVDRRVRGRINDYFYGEQRLPVYKDKPHFQSRRRRGGWTWKRLLALLAFFATASLWWVTWGTSSHTTPASVAWTQSRNDDAQIDDPVLWQERREKVVEVFKTSWDGYEQHAWGMDEYHPISKTGRNMVDGGMGWIIVDALDTMMMMNLTSRVENARRWIATSLNYDTDHDVSTFETTIRMLGGLLSAHYLSTEYPHLAPIREDDEGQPGEDLYKEKATGLADRLMGAFESRSGIPYPSVNLRTGEGTLSSGDGGASATAEAATLQLELKYLARLVGETHYWEKAEKVLEVIDNNHPPDGLVPIFVHADTGKFYGRTFRLGSRADSYYEYLIKQYLQTSEAETVYLDMWNESLKGIKKHLLTYSKRASLTVLAEREQGLDRPLSAEMEHLVCFLPGTIALAVTGGSTVEDAKARLGEGWTAEHDEDLALAAELMKTCWGMYKVTATGLAPETARFQIDKPPRPWVRSHHPNAPTSMPLEDASKDRWARDYDIRPDDVHNLQRPETVESLFYLYRITQDPMYRQWGWEIFESFIQHTEVRTEDGIPYAYTGLETTQRLPPERRDNMESFWLAETLKYLFLLFSPRTDFPLETHVINTEGHFFPRFEMGRAFKTGWTRSGTEKGTGSKDSAGPQIVHVETVKEEEEEEESAAKAVGNI